MKELIKSINNVKTELQKEQIKKGGKNTYGKTFDYFELTDFLPRVNELMAENGIIDIIKFDVHLEDVEQEEVKTEETRTTEKGQITTKIEEKKVNKKRNIGIATITLTNGIDSITHTVPYKDTEDESKMIKGIQWLGSEQTYLRRYLYILAFGIVENSEIDKNTNKPTEQTTTTKKEKQNPQEFIKEEAVKQTKKEIQQAINKAFESTEDRKAQLVIYELVDEKGKPTNKSLEEYNEILASIKKELGV